MRNTWSIFNPFRNAFVSLITCLENILQSIIFIYKSFPLVVPDNETKGLQNLTLLAEQLIFKGTSISTDLKLFKFKRLIFGRISSLRAGIYIPPSQDFRTDERHECDVADIIFEWNPHLNYPGREKRFIKSTRWPWGVSFRKNHNLFFSEGGVLKNLHPQPDKAKNTTGNWNSSIIHAGFATTH